MTHNIPLSAQAFQIDIAVIDQDISEVHKQNMLNHIIDLDCITLSEAKFKQLFYRCNTFAIPNVNIHLDEDLKKYIQFTYFTILGKQFCLIDEIYKNIESDLGFSRQMFSIGSNIALNKQINALKTLSDLIHNSQITSSLTWDDVINTTTCEFNEYDPMPKSPEVILTISVVFKCPTPGVYPIIIRINYKTHVTIY